MLSFENPRFVYEPFPMGVVKDVFEPAYYERLLESWPPHDLFEFKPELGNKYSLSEVSKPDQYHGHIASHPPWFEFYTFVKSEDFVRQVLRFLVSQNIDLGLENSPIITTNYFNSRGERARALIHRSRWWRSGEPRLSARFEFSMMPADQGSIKPHTDTRQKLITLVASMVREGEWNASFGGGTDMLRPKDITKNYNHIGRYLEFDEVEVLDTFPYEPNQCVFFIKTFNSLHAVRPMKGQGEAMRKTLTMNIETK